MLEINRRILIDELNKIENSLLDKWYQMCPWYNANDPIVTREYENIAGQINYIEKCKELLGDTNN